MSDEIVCLPIQICPLFNFMHMVITFLNFFVKKSPFWYSLLMAAVLPLILSSCFGWVKICIPRKKNASLRKFRRCVVLDVVGESHSCWDIEIDNLNFLRYAVQMPINGKDAELLHKVRPSICCILFILANIGMPVSRQGVESLYWIQVQ